ncbi:LemA family protein [Paenibacillus senegalimassiliensis]|uniref:LemA family protein n=1 Tax=Paenibacillus senegalimassiliensis TaxID=1737426 RepID=UPI00073E1398|nr:LemA family protein [Paenibacillus senegalimassiliensis]
MQLLKQSKVAWTITLALIIVSSSLGASLSLNHLREDAAATFIHGISKSEPGVQYDLDWLVELSTNLIVVASRYIDDEDMELVAVREAKSKLEAATSPKTKYDAADRLVSQSTALIYRLGQMELETRDAHYNKTIKADIESRWLILGRNNYNQVASEFNDVLKQFPASMFSKLMSVKPLELFTQ